MIPRSLFQGVLVSAIPVRRLPALRGRQKPSGTPQSIETKATKAAPIPNFATAYGLPFHSTNSLGYRLMEARQQGDPSPWPWSGPKWQSLRKSRETRPT